MKCKIKNVRITPGCTSCGACEMICPDVFVLEQVAHVKKNVDFTEHAAAIEEAAALCPVSVIEVEKDT